MILPGKSEYKNAQTYIHWEHDHWRQVHGRTYSRFGGFSAVASLSFMFKRIYVSSFTATVASPFLHWVSNVNPATGTITISYGTPPAQRQPKSTY